MKHLLANKNAILLIAWLSFFSWGSLSGQEFPYHPREILKSWDYYTLTEKLGEGQPIIDTLSGQAYIAGMAYRVEWINRPADLSFYFSDIQIRSFNLRFWSPNTSERRGKKFNRITDPVVRDSIIREYQIQDSLRNDSVKRLLRMNPDLLIEMNKQAERINEQEQRLYDLDSLRCDSIIFDISTIMETPYRQDTTSHSEPNARYYAVWLNKGLGISLKDYIDYIDVAFSIPDFSKQKAFAYGMDGRFEVYEKRAVKIGKDTVDVSLLALPDETNWNKFSATNLLIEPKKGQSFVEQLIDNQLIRHPEIRFEDLNADQVEEAWFSAVTDSTPECQIHQIFSLETLEPIILFNTQTDLYEATEGRLMHGFQAELTFSDGTSFLFPLDKNSPVSVHYKSTGVLKQDMQIIPGCVSKIQTIHRQNDRPLIEGHFELIYATTKEKLAEVSVRWKLAGGFWVVEDYWIIQ